MLGKMLKDCKYAYDDDDEKVLYCENGHAMELIFTTFLIDGIEIFHCSKCGDAAIVHHSEDSYDSTVSYHERVEGLICL